MEQISKEEILKCWRVTSLKYYHENKDKINSKRKQKRDQVKQQLQLLQELQK
jgi:hypothetical protein